MVVEQCTGCQVAKSANEVIIDNNKVCIHYSEEPLSELLHIPSLYTPLHTNTVARIRNL